MNESAFFINWHSVLDGCCCHAYLDVVWSIYLSVCWSHAKIAEMIKMLSGDRLTWAQESTY